MAAGKKRTGKKGDEAGRKATGARRAGRAAKEPARARSASSAKKGGTKKGGTKRRTKVRPKKPVSETAEKARERAPAVEASRSEEAGTRRKAQKATKARERAPAGKVEEALTIEAPRGHVEPAAEARAIEREAPVDPLEAFFFHPSEEGVALPAVVPGRRGAVRALAEGGVDDAYLTVRLGEEWYGIPIEALKKIVRPVPITRIPRVPPEVEGVTTLRGEVLPVFDLHRRFGLERQRGAPKARLIVLQSGEGPVAFLVEEVGEVWRPVDPVREPPPTALGFQGELIEVLLRADGRVLPVIDLETALRWSPHDRQEGNQR